MFENKKYIWLLTELAKHKMKLKILTVAFINNKEVFAFFESSKDGDVQMKVKNLGKVKKVFQTFLESRNNSIKNFDGLSPVAYLSSEASQKLLNKVEVKWLIKKEGNNCNTKEIILFQEHLHSFSTYFVMELKFDGKDLVSYLNRCECDKKEMIPDDRFLNLAMSLNIHLVECIEGLTEKNVVRLKYHFVIDPHFTIWIIKICQIKLVNQSVLVNNKGLSIELLENSVLVNRESKGLTKFVPSTVRHPETDPVTPQIVKPENSKIFMKFVESFLGDKKKQNEKKKVRSLSQVEFTNLEQDIQEFNESKFIEETFKQFKKQNTQSQFKIIKIGQIEKIEENEKKPEKIEKINKKVEKFEESSKKDEKFEETNKKVEKIQENKKFASAEKIQENKKLASAEKKSLSSCSSFIKTIPIFPSLKPSPVLSSFLKSEEERITKIQSKRLASSEASSGVIKPHAFSRKKLKKRLKNKKSERTSMPKLLSPYRLFQFFK